MGELNSRGRRTERQHHATRLVVDDFGDAVAYQWRCSSCMDWGNYPHYRCRSCGSWDSRTTYMANAEVERRDRARRRRDRLEANPLAREQERAKNKRAHELRMQRDGDREREMARARHARYRARVAADPERYRAYLEGHRIGNTLHRQARGRVTGYAGRRVNGTAGAHEVVPVAPLAFAAALFGDEALLAERSGVSDRLLRAWRKHERPTTRWESADAVLVALDKFWWEVFDPEDKPRGLFSGVRSRDVTGWLRAAERAVELWGDDDEG